MEWENFGKFVFIKKLRGIEVGRSPMETSAKNKIPVEIMSEEEMVFLEAALALARPLIAASLSNSRNQCRSVSLIPHAMPPGTPDIEESSVRLPRNSS